MITADEGLTTQMQNQFSPRMRERGKRIIFDVLDHVSTYVGYKCKHHNWDSLG